MQAVAGIQDFVSYVVKCLAGRPEDARVSRRQVGECHVFDVSVDQGDMGRLLGHCGNTVMAVRNLATAAAAHHGVEVGVEVVE